jgi:hypothetical protein
MPNEPIKSSKRVLDPMDRISEVLFGLIMVLTFTGSLSVAEAGRTEVRTMLLGALGCNLAWGIIDGMFYLMGCLAEKSRLVLTLRAVRNAADPQAAQRTRAYESDRDIQRGFLVGFSYTPVDLTTYVFNPDKDKPTVVVAAGVNF